jgi:excisionase family DNA binding protein
MEVRDSTPTLALNLEEARRHLRLGRNKTLELLYSGRLKAVKVGTRWVIPRSAVENFLAEELRRAEAGDR